MYNHFTTQMEKYKSLELLRDKKRNTHKTKRRLPKYIKSNFKFT